ncbi:MAG: sensor histidine kinase, partial [Acidobacteria bacterium]|nr:sensor histidine kinase [Acidobacteriota bacterium]
RVGEALPGLAAAAAAEIGIIIFALSDRLPEMMNRDGFTPLAKVINVLGGLFFLAAAVRFVLRYRERGSKTDFLFAQQCLLFGGAGVLFAYSQLWDAAWWYWHLLRLLAYLVVFGYAFSVYYSLQEELRESQGNLQDLAGQLISAREEETRHLARELHDAFGQKLAVLNLQLSELETLLSSRSDPVVERLRPLREGITTLAQSIHQLSRQLHPAVLRELGLETTLAAECSNPFQPEGLTVNFSSQNVPELLPDDLSLCLYRVVQESLQNIRKHAQATQAEVRLLGVAHEIVLAVEDFGNGFELGPARKKGGVGLASMEERVRLVGGRLSIRSRPGQGTRIEVRCPLERS